MYIFLKLSIIMAFKLIQLSKSEVRPLFLSILIKPISFFWLVLFLTGLFNFLERGEKSTWSIVYWILSLSYSNRKRDGVPFLVPNSIWWRSCLSKSIFFFCYYSQIELNREFVLDTSSTYFSLFIYALWILLCIDSLLDCLKIILQPGCWHL